MVYQTCMNLKLLSVMLFAFNYIRSLCVYLQHC